MSRRTIERDLAALKEVGLALSASRGAHGGVRLETSGRVLLVLTPAEVTALLLAATLAGDMPYAKAAKTATGKLAEALPPATRVQVEELCKRIQVVPASMPSGVPRVAFGSRGCATGQSGGAHRLYRPEWAAHRAGRRACRFLWRRRRLGVGGLVPSAPGWPIVPAAPHQTC